jgi:nicotinate phosphoribosyltransferase
MRFDEYTDLALLTDLYQLTMSYGYWKTQHSQREAVFHLFFRKLPFRGGFAVSAGQFIQLFRFSQSDIDYLASLRGNDARPLFESSFLDYLAELRLVCDVDAMPEGTVAFQNEPIVRVTGPIIQY